MNEAISGGAGVGYTAPIDVDLIERVEVVRGPSSSLYGTGAFFGVVNIITRHGHDLAGGEVAVSAGRFDTYTGRFTYGGRVGDDMELLISGSRLESDGQDFYFPEFDDPDTNDGWAKDADEERATTLFLQFLLHDLTLEMDYVDRTKHNPTASWGTIFSDPHTQDSDEQLDVSLTYDHAVAEHCSLYARLDYQWYDYEGIFPYDWAEEEGDPVDRVLNLDGARTETLGGEVKIVSTKIDAHTISGGIEYRRHYRQDQWNRDEGIEEWNLDSQTDSDVWGFYIQDEMQLCKNALLQAGIRYDYEDPHSQGDSSPRVGLILTPAEKSVLKFLYGQAFRSPSAYERYYHDGEVTTKASTDLDPEKIRTYEVVLEQGLTEYMHSSFSLYRYEIEDLITQNMDPTDELIQFENLNEATAFGLEAALQGRLHDSLDYRVSYSYVDAEDDDTGETLSNAPRNMAKLHANFPICVQNVFGGLEVLYTDSRKTVDGSKVGSYVVANATLLARDLPGGFEVSASIYNLFDEKYEYPVGEEIEQGSLEADGQSFRIKAQCRF